LAVCRQPISGKNSTFTEKHSIIARMVKGAMVLK
jgi:hypothetical protein